MFCLDFCVETKFRRLFFFLSKIQYWTIWNLIVLHQYLHNFCDNPTLIRVHKSTIQHINFLTNSNVDVDLFFNWPQLNLNIQVRLKIKFNFNFLIFFFWFGFFSLYFIKGFVCLLCKLVQFCNVFNWFCCCCC